MKKISIKGKTNTYIPIPRELIYASDIGDKRIVCYSYFFMNMTCEDTVLGSMDYLVRWCNYIPSTKKSKKTNMSMNDQFLTIIGWLEQNGYFLSLMDRTIKSCDLFSCDINRDKFLLSENFTRIYDFEFRAIKEECGSLVDTVLLVLTYLRINMWRNTEDCVVRKPEMTNRHYTTIAKDLGVSAFVAKKSVKILCDIGIIRFYTPTKFKDKTGMWHSEDMVFVNEYRYVYDKHTNTHHLDGRYNPDVEIKFGVKTLLEKRNHGGIYS